PKMLPRMPMAAGTSTSRPGWRARVSVREPRTAPAARLVALFSPSATSPWRASGPSADRRRTGSRGRRMVMQSDKAGWAPMRSTPSARTAALAVLGALAVLAAGWLVGCDTGDGRQLADPEPGATAPPLVTTTEP